MDILKFTTTPRLHAPPRRLLLPGTGTTQPMWHVIGPVKGMADNLTARGPTRVTVHDSNYAVYSDGESIMVTHDACEHRGASLACGKVNAAGCLVCPYHARSCSPSLFPERYFSTVESQGDVWVDFGHSASHSPPPTFPEFEEPEWRVIRYSRDLKVNPVLMTENTLDWSHLFVVHAVHFVNTTPQVTVEPRQPGSPAGKATYVYTTETVQMTVENEFHAPFTTSLRFIITDKTTGETLPPLLLTFSITPRTRDDVVIHLRIARKLLTQVPWITDALFRFLDELPLLEDKLLVAQVDPAVWSRNNLDKTDSFVQQYRTAMRDLFPDLLEYYVA